MKNFYQTLAVVAVLLPGLAFAQPGGKQVYDQDEQTRVRAHSETLDQDRLRVSGDEDSVTADQGALDRDKALLHWWAVPGDSERVRQDKLQLDRDKQVFAHDSGPADGMPDE
jgi:hypothetical protein